MVKAIPGIVFLLFLLVPTPRSLRAEPVETGSRFAVEVEAGPVWQTMNDVQIPNTDAGTRFSLVDLVGKGPWLAPRAYFTWNIRPRHSLRLLAAPLSYTESGEFSEPVDFEGEEFEAGVSTDGTYKFNSYRVTYAYRFHSGQSWTWWVGFTAKIRDAKIKLAQPGTSSEKTDLGFVPLLHLRGAYRFSGDWQVLFDLDALAGGPGRAEDGSIKLNRAISPNLSMSIGYRTVEGGADVDEVYNFAWLHYAVLSASYMF
jgi:hypothetical protein